MPEPRPAEEVMLTFHAGTADAVQVNLGRIVRRLAETVPVARGYGPSRVWRFCPLKGRSARPDEPQFALKRVGTNPSTGRPPPTREFDFLSRLSSPCFPRPVGHGLLENGDYVIVSEWVEGRVLARDSVAIVGGMLEDDDYRRFCIDLMTILARLQAAGIVHSDIWEPNIIVRRGRPVLVDFGCAREPGEPPSSPQLHQPDDNLAIAQVIKRLDALRDILLLEHQTRVHAAQERPQT